LLRPVLVASFRLLQNLLKEACDFLRHLVCSSAGNSGLAEHGVSDSIQLGNEVSDEVRGALQILELLVDELVPLAQSLNSIVKKLRWDSQLKQF
jgi:hypothetical protein